MDNRILVVCQRYWPDNYKLTDICEGFARRGIHVDVLCGQPLHKENYEKHKRVNKNGTEVRHGVRIYRAYETSLEHYSALNLILNCIIFRASSISIMKKLVANRYDRVFIYQLSPVTMCSAGLKAGMLSGIDTSLFVAELWPKKVIMDFDVRNGIITGFLNKLSLHYYGRADKIIVNSLNTKKYFEKTLNFQNSKIAYVPQSAGRLSEEMISNDDLRERFAGSFNIVYAGEVGSRQRFKAVLEALEMAVKDGIKDIKLIIAGKGATLEKIKNAVKAKNMTDYVFFEGNVPEQNLPEYFDMADVLLDTRKQDETEEYYVPEKIASYMAAGRPIIAAAVGEVKNIVKESGCGFWGDPDDTDTLYQNILRLYHMPKDKRMQLGENARAYQQTHFNRNDNIEKLLDEIYGESEPDGIEYYWFND